MTMDFILSKLRYIAEDVSGYQALVLTIMLVAQLVWGGVELILALQRRNGRIG